MHKRPVAYIVQINLLHHWILQCLYCYVKKQTTDLHYISWQNIQKINSIHVLICFVKYRLCSHANNFVLKIILYDAFWCIFTHGYEEQYSLPVNVKTLPPGLRARVKFGLLKSAPKLHVDLYMFITPGKLGGTQANSQVIYMHEI